MQHLINIINKESRRVIALMSGTSMDGVDLVDVQLTGSFFELEYQFYEHYFQAFDHKLQEQLNQFTDYKIGSIGLLNKKLGEFYLETIKNYYKISKIDPNQVDLVSIHGQTVDHSHLEYTYQIGEADVLAQKLKKTVIHDFRQADIAMSGSGAPLIPYFDKILASQMQKKVVFLNLGGISNFSYYNQADDITIATDAGPANMLSDLIVQIHTNKELKCDEGGKIATKGYFDSEIMEYFSAHPFMQLSFPKSLGRAEFGLHYVHELLQKFQKKPIEDLLLTSLYFTVLSIKNALERLQINQFEEIIINGGGSKNHCLVKLIQTIFPKKHVRRFEQVFKIPDSAKEALAFAVLAHERLNNQKTNLPEVTLAKQKVCLGKIATF